MPEPSWTERLKAAAQKAADKINASSANKALERHLVPQKDGPGVRAVTLSPETAKTVGDAGTATRKALGVTAKPDIVEGNRSFTKAVQPIASAAYRIAYTPRVATQQLLYGTGIQKSPEAFREENLAKLDAVSKAAQEVQYQQDLEQIRQMREALTKHN